MPVAPPPRLAARPPASGPKTFRGQVTAVDGGSVTVRGFGSDIRFVTLSAEGPTGTTLSGNPLVVVVGGRAVVCNSVHLTREVWTLTLPNGEVMTVRRADLRPRQFRADANLAAGGFRPGRPAALSYRLADARAGDEVCVLYSTIGEEEVCSGLSIERRPGGRVPPAPGDDPDAREPWHEYANAWQAFEEQGTPLPKGYDTEEVRADLGRRLQTAGIEAERLRARLPPARIAPPPREVKPKPPGQ